MHAGRLALSRSKLVVEMSDLRAALDKILKEGDPLAKTTYELATRGKANKFVADVLYAAALARFDRYGSFTAADAASVILDDSGKRIQEITLHKALSSLCQDKNGPVLEQWRTPACTTRYMFVLQTMRQYILLSQAARRGLMLSEQMLAAPKGQLDEIGSHMTTT